MINSQNYVVTANTARHDQGVACEICQRALAYGEIVAFPTGIERLVVWCLACALGVEQDIQDGLREMRLRIVSVLPHHYTIASRTVPGVVYHPDPITGQCDCPAAYYGKDCWHRQAALDVERYYMEARR